MYNYKTLLTKLLITFIALSVLSGCTPTTKQKLIDVALNQSIQCLQQIAVTGEVQGCLDVIKEGMTREVNKALNHQLRDWTDSAVKSLAESMGVELQRSFDKQQAIDGIIESLR